MYVIIVLEDTDKWIHAFVGFIRECADELAPVENDGYD